MASGDNRWEAWLTGRTAVRPIGGCSQLLRKYVNGDVTSYTDDEFGNPERVVLPGRQATIRYPTGPNHRRIGRVVEDAQGDITDELSADLRRLRRLWSVATVWRMPEFSIAW